jgi:hypothetical protein
VIVVLKRPFPRVFNFQGDGLSEEYARNDALRQVADNFYFSRFPKRASWELPGYMPNYIPPTNMRPKMHLSRANTFLNWNNFNFGQGKVATPDKN